ncbi:MAG: alanine dehydrogenase [Anaerolineae bacterium]|nr:alanine dehydrogenase [Anaerolineae bacterium]MCB9104487.1 alanine dehydrogenase [Anaerolineales bacterium]
MIVGIPKEIKDNEYRVSITPTGVNQLVDAGHTVLVETGAGDGSRFPDEQFAKAGAKIVSADAAWTQANLVVKVKEPLPAEYPYLRPDLVLFTYLHLAADERLTRVMVESGVTGIAYETVELPNGTLPLLTPMSEVAGRMSIQIGAHYLERHEGGRGKLLGGIPGVRPANVIVLGGGVVGTHAAQIALGMGAHVTLMDINLDRLRTLNETLHGNFTTWFSNPIDVGRGVRRADLVIGAVLVKGAKAPQLVTREMVARMKPGSVIVDVAVDQGGCIATTRPTTHSNPTFMVDGVLHYCVANMPGAVPRTSTYGLSNATLPYVLKLANQGFAEAVANDRALALGVNIYNGKIIYQAVAEAFNLPYNPLDFHIHSATR